MKTTMDLDDALLSQAKARAAARGTTLRALMEDALRAYLLPASQQDAEFELQLPVVEGARPPRVDIADRDALYDLMDDRR